MLFRLSALITNPALQAGLRAVYDDDDDDDDADA
jgi:hypothetical protein